MMNFQPNINWKPAVLILTALTLLAGVAFANVVSLGGGSGGGGGGDDAGDGTAYYFGTDSSPNDITAVITDINLPLNAVQSGDFTIDPFSEDQVATFDKAGLYRVTVIVTWRCSTGANNVLGSLTHVDAGVANIINGYLATCNYVAAIGGRSSGNLHLEGIIAAEAGDGVSASVNGTSGTMSTFRATYIIQEI